MESFASSDKWRVFCLSSRGPWWRLGVFDVTFCRSLRHAAWSRRGNRHTRIPDIFDALVLRRSSDCVAEPAVAAARDGSGLRARVDACHADDSGRKTHMKNPYRMSTPMSKFAFTRKAVWVARAFFWVISFPVGCSWCVSILSNWISWMLGFVASFLADSLWFHLAKLNYTQTHQIGGQEHLQRVRGFRELRLWNYASRTTWRSASVWSKNGMDDSA